MVLLGKWRCFPSVQSACLVSFPNRPRYSCLVTTEFTFLWNCSTGLEEMIETGGIRQANLWAQGIAIQLGEWHKQLLQFIFALSFPFSFFPSNSTTKRVCHPPDGSTWKPVQSLNIATLKYRAKLWFYPLVPLDRKEQRKDKVFPCLKARKDNYDQLAHLLVAKMIKWAQEKQGGEITFTVLLGKQRCFLYLSPLFFLSLLTCCLHSMVHVCKTWGVPDKGIRLLKSVSDWN